LGYDLPDGADQGFVDIVGRPPAEQVAINQLAQLQITTGTSPTTYNPEGRVTRLQMALFLTRLWSLGPYDLPAGIGPGFTDIATLPVGVQTAINQLAELGITKGTTPTSYNPGGIVTREQMASFLIRTMKALGWTPEAP
jgi:hypothetical protein